MCSVPLTIACSGFRLGEVAPPFKLRDLEMISRHKVFKMLLSKGKIKPEPPYLAALFH
jgi:hypothetical protein